MDATELKRLAAAEALRSVRSGMTLGLGTGTTSVELVKLLEKRVGKAASLLAIVLSTAAA